MEKRGVIEPGRTPPRGPAKPASQQTPASLDRDFTKQAADRAANALKK